MAYQRLLKLSLNIFLTIAGIAHAQPHTDYPAKPIRIIVPFTAGGLLDLVARSYGASIGEQLNTPVIVENRVGGAGTIGPSFVAKSPPDGHTLLVGSVVTHALNPHLLKSMPYDALRDFVAVGMLGANGNVLLVRSSFPASNLQEFITYAKAKQGALNYASASVGSSAHLATELLRTKIAGLDYTHVPYNGPSEALSALMGGHVDFMFANIGPALPMIASGKLKALVVTTQDRPPQLPNVPTASEAGVPGFEVVGWVAMFAPKGTPQAVISRLHEALTNANRDPALRQKMDAASMSPMDATLEESTRYVQAEHAKWGRVIRDAKLPKM